MKVVACLLKYVQYTSSHSLYNSILFLFKKSNKFSCCPLISPNVILSIKNIEAIMDFYTLIQDFLLHPKNNYLKYYREKFTSFATNGNLVGFESEFQNLFSKTDGIATKISRITYDNKSIFHFPDIINRRIQELEKKYYNKFRYHIKLHNIRGIEQKFIELSNDILDITRKTVLTYRRPSLESMLKAKLNKAD
ncbi:hypothetical protein [Streptococcus cuniculi]|uniref:Uncharacterized protein n=1 Tax=Streptococcus cuniculi TaxID=1432788 RepID=A0A4Y9JBE5_9STRE|nr:hypothetical protein [Streptococcus cuniculi]MBF0777859.1 hypothetical protein [Streptococcus cuniculi]TFU98157.1 hypothetical protein E4T82_03870 [Streptococcus cuniculi]